MASAFEAFRDLGLAFGAVMMLIYALVVGWFRSFRTPLEVASTLLSRLAVPILYYMAERDPVAQV